MTKKSNTQKPVKASKSGKKAQSSLNSAKESEKVSEKKWGAPMLMRMKMRKSIGPAWKTKPNISKKIN